ncbi:hypothetical protein CDAR_421881 [Caerostris darwini]|uniref:Uncharacterized protein n=1 Tax=Caerostris darwini TaxID=1538125 RepID=A0AAV4VB77_9ARAC|nr:hypothetical protein CDAR_421881 [Caerostris darwini]
MSRIQGQSYERSELRVAYQRPRWLRVSHTSPEGVNVASCNVVQWKQAIYLELRFWFHLNLGLCPPSSIHFIRWAANHKRIHLESLNYRPFIKEPGHAKNSNCECGLT